MPLAGTTPHTNIGLMKSSVGPEDVPPSYTVVSSGGLHWRFLAVMPLNEPYMDHHRIYFVVGNGLCHSGEKLTSTMVCHLRS